MNTVCPGPVPTDMLKGIPEEVVENQMRNTPMENRLGSTDDVAQVVGGGGIEVGDRAGDQCEWGKYDVLSA